MSRLQELERVLHSHCINQVTWKACIQCGRIYEVPKDNEYIWWIDVVSKPARIKATLEYCGPCYEAAEPQRQAMKYAKMHPKEVLELRDREKLDASSTESKKRQSKEPQK